MAAARCIYRVEDCQMQPRSYIWQMDALTYAISNTHLSTCSMSHTPQLRNLSLITTFTFQTHQSPSPPTTGPHAPARPPPARVLGRHGESSIRCTRLTQGWTPTGHFTVSVAGPVCDTDGGVCTMRSAVLQRRDDDTTGGMAVGGLDGRGRRMQDGRGIERMEEFDALLRVFAVAGGG